MSDVVERAGEERDRVAVNVGLRANPVVLVLGEPGVASEIGIGFSLQDRRCQHEADRRAQRNA